MNDIEMLINQKPFKILSYGVYCKCKEPMREVENKNKVVDGKQTDVTEYRCDKCDSTTYLGIVFENEKIPILDCLEGISRERKEGVQSD